MTQEQMERATALPGEVLHEARRVFGDSAEVHYGDRWATAGVALLAEDGPAVNELTVWHDDSLGRLLACLKALPGASP